MPRKNTNTSVLLAGAPIHIVLIRNNTISLASRNVPQSVFCQIRHRGPAAAAALCVCSKQYINSSGYSAERQHEETKAGPDRAPKTGARALATELGWAHACG